MTEIKKDAKTPGREECAKEGTYCWQILKPVSL